MLVDTRALVLHGDQRILEGPSRRAALEGPLEYTLQQKRSLHKMVRRMAEHKQTGVRSGDGPPLL